MVHKRLRNAHHKRKAKEETVVRFVPGAADALNSVIGWDQDPTALEIATRVFAGGAQSRVGDDLMPKETELVATRSRLLEIVNFLRLVAREAQAARLKGQSRTIQLGQPQTFRVDESGRFERSRAGGDRVDFVWQEVTRKLEAMADVSRIRECERCRHLFLAVQERSRFCARRCANAAHQSKYVKRISGPKGRG